ncbi:hypothetical protein ES703_45718 [subsurface metagenome]
MQSVVRMSALREPVSKFAVDIYTHGELLFKLSAWRKIALVF